MIEPRFVELLTKELVEGLTFAEKQELELLLQQNAELKKQSASIKEYWNSGKTEYKASAAGFEKVMNAIHVAEQSAAMDSETVSETKTRHIWSTLRYVAAVVILGVSLSVWFVKDLNVKSTYQALKWETKTTIPRMKTKLILSDSTVVVLNSGTTFKYPASFGNGRREVYLSGEAFFEVHKDSKRPFIIHTREMNVKVLGTAFNIKSYDNESHSETSLIHGSIEVTLNDRKADRIILKPHEKLIIENTLSTNNQLDGKATNQKPDVAGQRTQYALTNLTYLPNIDTAAVETLWLKNKLVFKNEDFASIAAGMDRWYGVNIIFKNEALKNLRFTATFERETIIEALESLRLTEDFRFKKDGTNFYISK